MVVARLNHHPARDYSSANATFQDGDWSFRAAEMGAWRLPKGSLHAVTARQPASGFRAFANLVAS
jgi:hypothetical protein